MAIPLAAYAVSAGGGLAVRGAKKLLRRGKRGVPFLGGGRRRYRPKRIVLTERHLEFIRLLMSGRRGGGVRVPTFHRRHRRRRFFG